MTPSRQVSSPSALRQARLPRWLLGPDWPCASGRLGPALARITLDRGRVSAVVPEDGEAAAHGDWHLEGALVLPGLVDAHVHLDKTFTLSRIPDVKPGLLGAIEATLVDLPNWTEADIHERATRGLQWAWEAGTTLIRSHVNWSEFGPLPMAWPVLDRLAHDWADRLQLQLVSLTRLDSFADPSIARTVARQVKDTGPHALMGGFVHSTNWHPTGLRQLIEAAQAHDLDLDLHVDEELFPQAQGLRTVARMLRETGFGGRVVCGHVCALAAMPEDQALAILDEVAQVPITLLSLPITNLLLQDAVTDRTPRQRGITLVKEARARGIPLLFASDNVQDPFCPVGSYDPLECLSAAAIAAQLDAPFDRWSDTLCRTDFLARGRPVVPGLVGQPADLVIFIQADATGWPSRSGPRLVLRTGTAHSAPPTAWLSATLPVS